MPNNLLTSDLISNTALASFSVMCPFLQTGERLYQEDFTSRSFKPGDTVNVRRVNQYIAGDGSSLVPQSINEEVEPITISHQYNVGIEYTMQDLTLRIEDFNEKVIKPAIQTIIAKMETDIGAAADKQLNFYLGGSGVNIGSYGAVDDAGVKLLEQAVNITDNAYMALSIRQGSQAKRGIGTGFTPMLNEEIVRKSTLGHVSYFDMFQSQNMFTHLAGTSGTTFAADALTVNGQVASGNTIVLSGANGAAGANYFVPGDAITIEGVQNVNPLTYAPTQNAQFVVTAPATAVAGAVTIQVSPAIISDPTNSRRNVSSPIPTGSVVRRVGNAVTNVAYVKRALSIVCPPLGKLQVPFSSVATDPVTGLSLSIAQQGEILSYQNIMRFDLLCGFKWHPQYAVKYFTTTS